MNFPDAEMGVNIVQHLKREAIQYLSIGLVFLWQNEQGKFIKFLSPEEGLF